MNRSEVSAGVKYGPFAGGAAAVATRTQSVCKASPGRGSHFLTSRVRQTAPALGPSH